MQICGLQFFADVGVALLAILNATKVMRSKSVANKKKLLEK